MPKYKWNIGDLLYEEDVRKMYELAKNAQERALIAFLWITGARPTEITMLRRNNLIITNEKLEITLATLKRGKSEKFDTRERTLTFDRHKEGTPNIYIETIIGYVQGIPGDERVMPYTSRWTEKTTARLGTEAIKKPICPYHFRHSVLTLMARNGATPDMLKHFKGAKSLSSVNAYMDSIPFVVKLQNLNRSRALKEAGIGEIAKPPVSQPATPTPLPASEPSDPDFISKNQPEPAYRALAKCGACGKEYNPTEYDALNIDMSTGSERKLCTCGVSGQFRLVRGKNEGTEDNTAEAKDMVAEANKPEAEAVQAETAK